MSELEQIVRAKQAGKKPIAQYVQEQERQIQSALPSGMDAARFVRAAITLVRTTPKLSECTVPSILGGLMLAAQTGLTLNSVQGHAYLVPFRNKAGQYEATFILGYKGMADLAWRSGRLKDISASVVYEGDKFSFQRGTTPKIDHSPTLTDKGGIIGYYAVARFTSGGSTFDVLNVAEAQAARERSRAKGSGPWVTDFDAMAKKSCVRRLAPYLPLSPEMQSVFAADESVVEMTGDSENMWRPKFDDEDDEEIIQAEVVE